MKTRPILFSAPMVRALLDGSKMQTRRIVKQRNTEIESAEHGVSFGSCPYGQQGDRLWVRESWSIEMLWAHGTENGYDSTYELSFKADGFEQQIRVLPGKPDPYIKLSDSQRGDWRPSIHMPRWASRITLEITSVRVERLQDINEADAIAEGIIEHKDLRPADQRLQRFWRDYRLSGDGTFCVRDPIQSYRSLWESINGPDSWSANPWVWCVSFRVLDDAPNKAAS